MQQTLFIDFHKTLCDDEFWRSLPNKNLERLRKYLFSGETDLMYRWMRGEYTSEEVNATLARYLNIEPNYLWQIFVSDCEEMSVSEDVLKAINQLRTKYEVILLTDNMDCFTRFTVPALHLEKYFDKIVNSYSEGSLKTDNDGEIFLKHLKGNISDAILIDDSANVCANFYALGGKYLQITEGRDLAHLLNLLTISS